MISAAFNELSLHVQTRGQGPELVFIHGWGMHGGIWDDVAGELESQFRIHQVDLPGHGQSPLNENAFELPTVTEQLYSTLATILEEPAVIVGWSLGGMVATHFATQYPRLVHKLVLIATNLRFSKTEDWPDAVEQDLLNLFANELTHNFSATLQRFLALQVKGDEYARQTLRELRQRITRQKEPDAKALEGGLQILSNDDLRQHVGQLNVPVKCIFGEHDMLVPESVVKKINILIPNCNSRVIEGAGHAPFISHSAEFLKELKEFIHE